MDTADSIGSWAAAGSGAPALTVLTGHDVTLFPLLVFLCRASKLELPSFWPGYSSCLVLELHGPPVEGGSGSGGGRVAPPSAFVLRWTFRDDFGFPFVAAVPYSSVDLPLYEFFAAAAALDAAVDTL